jgi:GT2 family glycosyltransferase
MIEVTGLADVERDGAAWRAVGEAPQLLLRPDRGGLPTGWVLIRCKLDTGTAIAQPVIYLDDGSGHAQAQGLRVSAEALAGSGVLMRLPAAVEALRLSPFEGPGRFSLTDLQIRPVGRRQAIALRSREILKRQMRDPRLLLRYARVAFRLLRSAGPRGTIQYLLRERPMPDAQGTSYADWVKRYDTLSATDRAAIADRIAGMMDPPRISVIVPLYDTPEPWLRKCIESVRAQLWPRWELCLADDASPAPHVQAICEEYARQDPRIRYRRRSVNGHIAAASNTALEMATGDFVALLDHDDELAPHALYMVAEALQAQPDLDMIFSDEDKINESGDRYAPCFKSDWNYDLLLAQNAVVHLAVYRRSLLLQAGGFRPGFDGSQDYDLTLRASELTTPERIRHLPFILYHWRAIAGSVALDVAEKDYPYEAARRALQEHLDRTGRAGAVVERQTHPGYYHVRWPLPANPPRVSIIIPTRDKVELLRVAVDTILQKTTYPDIGIVVVDNGSTEKATQDYLAEVTARDARLRVLAYDQPYSFAALNNWAVRQVDSPLVAFVNNDVEVITPEWLDEMAAIALRPEVGAVGCKLLYPNDTIQHAGIVVGIGGLAGHPHVGHPLHSLGYFGRLACAQRYSAVTGACLVMRREVFLAHGGFDEENFAIAFNDVDLCLRLNRDGLAVVWTPHAVLYHHESASLGPPNDDVRRARFERECANLRRLWSEALRDDPFYNPNLTHIGGDWTPAFPPRVRRPWSAAD